MSDLPNLDHAHVRVPSLSSGALGSQPLASSLSSGALGSQPLASSLSSGALGSQPLASSLSSGALGSQPLASSVSSGAALDGPRAAHPPRILLLYGSLRERSYSRLLTLEAARLLEHFGCEARVFDPHGLPMTDSTGPDHPKVKELRALSDWSEGQVWCSPERHGAITGVFKTQIDWLPLNTHSIRPTQGRTLAVMQVSGGSQSFNAVNTLRLLGRWMRMFTIPNQSSVAKAFQEFDEAGRMKPSSYYDRLVDVMEELVKFTLLLRGSATYLTDRYSERKEQAEKSVAAALAAAAMVHETNTERG